MPTPSGDVSDVLSAWRKVNDRDRIDFLSLRRHRGQRSPPLTSTEVHAVTRAVSSTGSLISAVEVLPQLARIPYTPSLEPRRANPATTASKSNRNRSQLYRRVVDVNRQHEEEMAAIDKAVRKQRQLYIAASPQRLAAQMARNAQVTSIHQEREAHFDQTTSIEHHDEHTDKLTPRHVKAQYLKSLEAAEASQIVPRDWKRSPRTRSTSPQSTAGRLSPASSTIVAQRLERKAIFRLSRTGLPNPSRFEAVSEAISAVVASTAAARLLPEPRGLCGDTMTYWDRLNFYGKFAESCGNDEETMRSAVMRSTHR